MSSKCTDDKTDDKMPMLDHCWCCSLQVACSVIAVYTTVAYVIAFVLETWWIWQMRGRVPYLAFILTIGYLVTFLLSAILIRGVSHKRMSYLLMWILGIIAILIPESGLAIFMGVQFWKVHTLYGLTEVTCWACRLTVNIAGIICVQSLYSQWKEEKQVLTSLRDLNMVSTLSRRSSVGNHLQNSYSNPGFRDHVDHSSNHGTNLKRSGSTLSLASNRSLPPPKPKNLVTTRNEFNASLFDTKLHTSMSRSRSMLDLSNGSAKEPIANGKIPSKPPSVPREPPEPRLVRSHSLSYFPTSEGRLRNGYFPPQYPAPGFIVDPMGRVAYVQDPIFLMAPHPYFHPHKRDSRTSLAESDDAQRYRDVAL